MNAPAPLEIFKPGRHVAMSGVALDFSETDLAATAAAYDPAKHEAPLVIGHPRHDAPAYGWVKGLAAGAVLEAQSHQVEPAFAEMVAAGRFKKISASFYTPDSPQNPVPGVYYLRHVGFLGAQPPAVKGLRTPEFAEAEEGVVEFGDWSDQQNASLWRSLREWLIAKFGLEEADKVVSQYAVGTLEDEARRDDTAQAQPVFAEQPTQGDDMSSDDKARLDALEAENARLKADAEARAAAEAAAAIAARHTDNAAFAEGLAKAGRLLPAQTGVAVAALDHLSAPDAAVEFGEGEAKKPLAAAFREFLAALPPQVEFGEAATRNKAAAEGGVDVTDAESISKAAVEFQEAEAKAGRVVSISSAVQHVVAAKK